MKRVCKPDGHILILTSGKSSSNEFLDKYLDLRTPYMVQNYGYFANRDWSKIITEEEFKIERFERELNGTLYFYVLRNKK